MNRKSKRSKLRKVNQSMKLNGLPKLSMDELNEMEKFNLGYQLEASRIKRKRTLGLLMLLIYGIATLLTYIFGGFDWLIIEILNWIR